MMVTAAFLASAIAADYLTMLWHRARDAGKLWRLVSLSMLLESLTWAAMWVALVGEDWTIAIVSIVGSGIGTRLGYSRVAANNSQPVVESAVCVPAVCCPPSPKDSTHG